MDYPAPSPKYLGPPAHWSEGANKPIRRVVIHSTVSPCEPGGAEQIAAYFRSQSAGGSAHYVVDPENTVQAAYDSVICWHAPPNQNSLGIEMCDTPGPVPTADVGSTTWKKLKASWRWTKPNQQKMLKRTARLTAKLCLAYNLPPYFVTAKDLKRGVRGVTTHAEVSKAWGQSTHWDPGFWPRTAFMLMVRSEVKRLKRKHNA